MKANLRMVSRQAGVTLVEFMILASLAALLILGAFQLAANARSTTESQTEMKNLQTIAGKTRSVFQGRNSYVGVTAPMIIRSNGFPVNMVSGTTARNLWDGNVGLAVGTATNTFDITYTNVPTANCIELANGLGANFNSITVAGGVVKAPGTTATNVADVDTQCSSANNVTMVFNSL